MLLEETLFTKNMFIFKDMYDSVTLKCIGMSWVNTRSIGLYGQIH